MTSVIDAVESWTAGSLHVVRITTSEGEVGLGQSSCWAYPTAVDAVIAEFRPVLLGLDPARIERIWHTLYRMGPFRGSVLSGAVSAIDIALWDLKARSLEVPLYELLGGLGRDAVRLHMLILGWSDLDELLDRAAEAVAEGFTAIKFDPLPSDQADLASSALCHAIATTVGEVRARVGNDTDLIVELHRSLTALEAPTILAALAAFRPLFVEDPLQIDSINLQADAARNACVSLGQGERLHSIWEFRELLERGGPQYVRADVALANGISHCRKIAAVAESFGAAVAFHTFSGPIATAATLHLELTLPNLATHEWYPPVDEPGAIPSMASAAVRDGGWLAPAAVPGIGVQFDERQLAPFFLNARALHDVPLRRDGSVTWAV